MKSSQEKGKNSGSIKTTQLHKTRPSQDILRINITLTGDIVEFYRELKLRGLVTSTRDFILQMYRPFKENLLESDLRKAQLESLKERSADAV